MLAVYMISTFINTAVKSYSKVNVIYSMNAIVITKRHYFDLL